MPTYHYRCSVCGHSRDVVHKITEDPLVVCMECYLDVDREEETPPMQRVIKNFNNKVLFKGKGWDGTPDHSTH